MVPSNFSTAQSFSPLYLLNNLLGGTWGHVILLFFTKLLHPRLSTQWWYLPALIFRITFAKWYFFPTVIGQYFPVRKTLCFSFVMDSFIYLFISVCRLMGSHHWVIIYQCFDFDTLNIPVLVSGSPLKVMLVFFLTCLYQSFEHFLTCGTRCSRLTFPAHLKSRSFLQRVLVLSGAEWYLETKIWVVDLLIAAGTSLYIYFFLLVDKANDDGRRRGHYYNLHWFEAPALLSFLVMLNGWGMCSIILFLFGISFVGRMCRVIWIQEAILIWALTKTFEIWGLLLFLISRALSVSRAFKI